MGGDLALDIDALRDTQERWSRGWRGLSMLFRPSGVVTLRRFPLIYGLMSVLRNTRAIAVSTQTGPLLQTF